MIKKEKKFSFLRQPTGCPLQGSLLFCGSSVLKVKVKKGERRLYILMKRQGNPRKKHT